MADRVGGVMFNTRGWIALGLLSTFALPAMAQSFRVQCPTNTVTHPNPANNNLEPTYVGPTYTGTTGYGTTPAHVNGAIVPADLRRRRLRDHGRWHADLPV